MSHDHNAEQAHSHPTGTKYVIIGAILTIITAVEVWLYYIPAAVASPLFNPTMLAMSAAKFLIVVLFYMHLKFDHKIFRMLFAGPMIIAGATIIALMFLFGHFAL